MEQYNFLLHNFASGEDISFLAMANSKKEAWELAEKHALTLEPCNGSVRNVMVMGIVR